MSTLSHRRDSVFISYCQKDAKWLDLLTKHLTPFLQNTKMSIWDDRRIKAGDDWRAEIQAALQRAAVAVLLLTPDYLASDLNTNGELQHFLKVARNGGLKLLWIAVKSSAVEETPIASYQALNDPAKPLAARHHAYQDMELKRMCRAIRETWLSQCAPELEPTSPWEPFPKERSTGMPFHEASTAGTATDAHAQDMSEAVARRQVHAVLGGVPSEVTLWRDKGSSRYMAMSLRQEKPYGGRVQVLQQVGLTFTTIWTSDEFWDSLRLVQIADIDEDGIDELLFEDKSYGSLGGERRLTIYFPKRKLQVFIIEAWSRGPAEPVAPSVAIKPALDDSLLRYVESAASRCGFLLGASDYDLDSPKFAPQRWHADNPQRETGKMKIHFYPGYPELSGSTITQVEGGGFEWIAEFKGALYAYDRAQDRHFVVFSAADIYNWVNCIVYHAGVLWFTVHMDSSIYSFENARQIIRRHALGMEDDVFEVESFDIDRDRDELVWRGVGEQEKRESLAALLAAQI